MLKVFHFLVLHHGSQNNSIDRNEEITSLAPYVCRKFLRGDKRVEFRSKCQRSLACIKLRYHCTCHGSHRGQRKEIHVDNKWHAGWISTITTQPLTIYDITKIVFATACGETNNFFTYVPICRTPVDRAGQGYRRLDAGFRCRGPECGRQIVDIPEDHVLTLSCRRRWEVASHGLATARSDCPPRSWRSLSASDRCGRPATIWGRAGVGMRRWWDVVRRLVQATTEDDRWRRARRGKWQDPATRSDCRHSDATDHRASPSCQPDLNTIIIIIIIRSKAASLTRGHP